MLNVAKIVTNVAKSPKFNHFIEIPDTADMSIMVVDFGTYSRISRS